MVLPESDKKTMVTIKIGRRRKILPEMCDHKSGDINGVKA
jgi:hypothetical protein